MSIQIDDIIAALLMSLAMMRRLEPLSAQLAWNPHVAPTVFGAWKVMALRAYNLAAGACLAKVVLNQLWMRLGSGLGLSIGGALIAIAWIVSLVIAWRWATEASAMARENSIIVRSPKR